MMMQENVLEKRLQQAELGGKVTEHLEHHCSDGNYALGVLE